MGLSTFRRATELKVLVDAAASMRQGNECDAALAARILGQREALKATWSEDTCRRYLCISERFNQEAINIMTKWEMKYGRACLLDSLSIMRSAATAAQSEEQMATLVRTLFWEQTCKLRTSLEGRTKPGGGGNATALLEPFCFASCFTSTSSRSSRGWTTSSVYMVHGSGIIWCMAWTIMAASPARHKAIQRTRRRTRRRRSLHKPDLRANAN